MKVRDHFGPRGDQSELDYKKLLFAFVSEKFNIKTLAEAVREYIENNPSDKVKIQDI